MFFIKNVTIVLKITSRLIGRKLLTPLVMVLVIVALIFCIALMAFGASSLIFLDSLVGKLDPEDYFQEVGSPPLELTQAGLWFFGSALVLVITALSLF